MPSRTASRLHRPVPLLVACAATVLVSVAAAPPSAEGAVTTLTECRFSPAQVFDVQWSISDGFLNVSGLTIPYASFEPRDDQLEESELDDSDFFRFFTADGEIGLRLFTSDGTLKFTLHEFGTFRAVGPDFIFYEGGDDYGTLITTGEGFAYGDATSLAISAEDVSITDALNYDTCAAVPLGIGVTRDSLPTLSQEPPAEEPESSGGPSEPAPDPTRRMPDPVDVAAGVAVAQSDGLGRTGALLVRRDVAVPLSTSVVAAAGPRGGLVIEDPDRTLRVTITTAQGVSATDGIVVATDGEIVCEICAALANDSVVEAWIYSDPRLAAAVRIEADPEFECPLLRIPVGAPLDGAGPIEPGPHTLQLRLSTPDGIEIVAVPITVGTTAGELPLPDRINAGGGPVPVVPLGMLLVVALLGAITLTTERGRDLAAAGAAQHAAHLRARTYHRLPAFDILEQRLAERRHSLHND